MKENKPDLSFLLDKYQSFRQGKINVDHFLESFPTAEELSEVMLILGAMGEQIDRLDQRPVTIYAPDRRKMAK
jgi:hypothetical protein